MWTDSFANPFPKRQDLMSLSTITNNDAPTKKLIQGQNKSLQTNDIEGAKPQLQGYQFNNKITTANCTQDIESAYPKVLKVYNNKPCFINQHKDIERSWPQKIEFITNRVPHNPLEPRYKLPTFQVRPFTPPKFIRDNLKQDDIEGCSPISNFK